MSATRAMKWIRVGLIAALFSLPSIADSQATSFSWPVPSPCSLMTSYGQYQHKRGFYYLHDGIDILKDSTTYVTAVEDGWVAKRDTTGIGGTNDWYLAIGTSKFVDNDGWLYAHLRGDPTFPSKWPIDKAIKKGDTLGQVHLWNPSQETHLHFERDWGFRKPKIIMSAEWEYSYPYKNPLLILDTTGLAQRHNVDFGGKRVQRDSTESAFGNLKFKYDTLTLDTTWIVNRKIDIEDKCFYQIGSTAIGAYKVTYSISGTGTQGSKGFIFSDRLQTALNSPPTDSAAAVARTVCDTARSAFTVGCYLISNTDSMNNHFEYGNLSHLHGYWNTAQHKDSAWNCQHNADSNAVAKFRDGWGIIQIRGEDELGNYKLDTLKVIVNNFPPQVKQTYPVDGSAGVSRACTLRVWFDQPMDTVSAKAGFHLRLKNSTTDISGTKWFYSGSDTFMLFKPDSLLLADTTYLMKVSTSTKDIADSTMTSNHLVWFSTRDIYVHVSRAYQDTARIEIRDSLLHYRSPPQKYAEYPLVGASPVWGEKIALDREGNRYVCESVYTSGVNRIAKYDSLGNLVAGFQRPGSFHSVATEGAYLFAVCGPLAPSDTAFPHYITRIKKMSLATGDSLHAWISPDSTRFTDISFSPADGYLYIAAVGKLGRLDNRIYRYDVNGNPQGAWQGVDTLNTDVPRLTCGKNLIYTAMRWPSTFTRGDTIVIFNLSLTPIDTFAAADGGPGGTYHQINSIVSDANHLYVLLRSSTVTQTFYWVHEFTPSGVPIRPCTLAAWSSSNPSYAALAAYPSVIGVTGTEPPPGEEDGDGGPQADGSNALLPKVYALGPSYPNPAKAGLKIDYALPKESQVSLRIYNVMGQLVRSLREGKEKPGFYKAEWDGKDQQGKRVASGVYLYRMEAGEFRKTRKLVVIR